MNVAYTGVWRVPLAFWLYLSAGRLRHTEPEELSIPLGRAINFRCIFVFEGLFLIVLGVSFRPHLLILLALHSGITPGGDW